MFAATASCEKSDADTGGTVHPSWTEAKRFDRCLALGGLESTGAGLATHDWYMDQTDGPETESALEVMEKCLERTTGETCAFGEVPVRNRRTLSCQAAFSVSPAAAESAVLIGLREAGFVGIDSVRSFGFSGEQIVAAVDNKGCSNCGGDPIPKMVQAIKAASVERGEYPRLTSAAVETAMADICPLFPFCD